MKNIFVMLVAVVLVAGCPSPEEIAASQRMAVSQLPEGCQMKYLGRIKVSQHTDIPTLVVTCSTACTSVTTTSSMRPSGKTTAPSSTVSIERLEAALKDEKRALAVSKLSPEELELLGVTK